MENGCRKVNDPSSSLGDGIYMYLYTIFPFREQLVPVRVCTNNKTDVEALTADNQWSNNIKFPDDLCKTKRQAIQRLKDAETSPNIVSLGHFKHICHLRIHYV
jgi:hypothetical protein